jgi:hypothetical protein
MKIDPEYRPKLLVSKDVTRPNLTAPYLDVAAKKLVVTNGCALIAFPVEVEAGDESGHRDPVTLEPIASRGCFPKWQEVVPDSRRRTTVIALDPALLLRIAKAAGWRMVTLEFGAADAQILVRSANPGGGFGVIAVQMPVRT